MIDVRRWNSGKVLLFGLLIFFLNFVSSAHYIVGYVDSAMDGESSDNKIVIMWNSANGMEDNITAIVGPNGDTGESSAYMMDCEMLNNPCKPGDIMSIRVLDKGDGYVSREDKNVTVSGAGYEMVENLKLNSLPIFNSILVDDSFDLILDEIDLIVNSTREVFCSAVIEDLDGDFLSGFYAEFFHVEESDFGFVDDNNNHYTNSSCFVNRSHGNENETFVYCSYDIFYYAYSGNWNCQIEVNDSYVEVMGVDSVRVNPLLAVEVEDQINFTAESSGNVSNEVEIKIKNVGNVEVDLSLFGYGESPGDNLAMSCSRGDSIPVYYKKYNLISSFLGNLTLEQFEENYMNLSGSPVFEDFNLSVRENDSFNDAERSTFWRIFIPEDISGICSGNIEISAVSV